MGRILTRLWQGWKQGARRSGEFQSRLVLTLIYFPLFAPLTLVARVKDPLGRRRHSRWQPCHGRSADLSSAFLGFEVNEGEYKVMGLAPCGEPKYVDKVEKLIRINPDGSFDLNMAYLSYHYHSQPAFNGKFAALFGKPRNPKARFVTAKTSLYDDPTPPTRAETTRGSWSVWRLASWGRKGGGMVSGAV